MTKRWASLLTVSAMVIAQGALWAGTAHAATGNVSLNGSVVHYEADNVNNLITITHVGTNIIIDDVWPMTAGVGCWTLDSTRVACADSGVTAVRVDGNDGDDRINSAMDLPVGLSGGDGDDVLSGGDGNDTLRGGPGSDTMAGDGGRDVVTYSGQLRGIQADLEGDRDDGASGEGDLIDADVEDLIGGDGDDTLRGDHGSNRLYGNGGDDTVFGRSGADTIYGGAGNDVLEGMDDDDDVYGGDGNDRIGGGNGDDFLSGEAGNDVLEGGFGFDSLLGGAGNDQLFGQGDPDFMDGGPDGDICEDSSTWVAVSCE
ncbi:calcium-binding protein [Allorhizocola rhizosphaerae]|uniref:calcium-binding protein n=1 Tax=Allorhizocola rhizosphaerae TaxID=1872709 RepID=UPI000E3D5388|nr:calcium-binding protein [Allorhizocola rhizosphaerae]